SAVRGCQRADSKGERHVSAETVAARSSHRLAPLQRMQVFVTLARPAGAERVRLSVAYADVAELAFGHLAQQAAIVGGFLSSRNESVQAPRRAFEDPRRIIRAPRRPSGRRPKATSRSPPAAIALPNGREY